MTDEPDNPPGPPKPGPRKPPPPPGLAGGCASAAPDWREVRLVKDRAAVEGCTLLTILKDEDVNDLRRRAAESGGDTVLLTGTTGGSMPVFDPERYVGDVYRCRAAGR